MPEGSRMALKAPQPVTHRRRLKRHSRMPTDLARLEPVLALLAGQGLRAALEIRHASCFVAATLSLL